MKDDTDPDQVEFKSKVRKVKKSGIHLDSHQLYAQMVKYVKTIGLHKRYIPMRYIMYLVLKCNSYIVQFNLSVNGKR